jgi:hypothetical protein
MASGPSVFDFDECDEEYNIEKVCAFITENDKENYEDKVSTFFWTFFLCGSSYL